MAIELVVTQPFSVFAKGQVISDPDAVAAAQANSPHCVVARTKTPDPDQSAPKPKAKA